MIYYNNQEKSIVLQQQAHFEYVADDLGELKSETWWSIFFAKTALSCAEVAGTMFATGLIN